MFFGYYLLGGAWLFIKVGQNSKVIVNLCWESAEISIINQSDLTKCEQKQNPYKPIERITCMGGKCAIFYNKTKTYKMY